MPIDFPNSPTNGQTFTVGDTTWVYQNSVWSILTSSASYSVCTSSSRPGSPGEGRMIYETDTNKALIYNGTSWIEISDLDNTGALSDASPRGILGKHSLETAFNTSSNHTTYQDDGLTTSVTYAANRILKVTYNTRLYAPGGANRISARILRGSTVIATTSTRESLSTTVAENFSWCFWFTGPSSGATETFKAQIGAATNNSQVSSFAETGSPKILLIEDIGAA